MKRTLALLLVLVGVLYALMIGLSSAAYRAQQEQTAWVPPLPMKFAHIDHAQQRCVDCHHNFEDDTGQGMCIDCHFRDPELAVIMEQQFHDLCRGCHLEKAMAGEEAHGPLRHCVDCHQEDFMP